MSQTDGFFTLEMHDERDALVILDQTLLPCEVKYIELKTAEDVWWAIKKLQVRGAPAIGVSAGYGAYLAAKHFETDDLSIFRAKFKEIRDYLSTSRPTAVNLFWALDRMGRAAERDVGSVAELKKVLLDEAQAINDEDISMCKAMAENGLSLLKPNMGLITHCNAGKLAAVKYGTALAPMYLGHERGYNFKVFSDETRPLLQGARLTAWELHQSGIDVTVLCDGMSSLVMKNGWVDACLVGCDRVAANGDAANKIGTSNLAIVAKSFGIPFYVIGPTSTIDMNCPTGADIRIELRDETEISEMWYAKRMAPEGVKAYNPAFDVTDNKYITAIVTDKGVVYPPFDVNLKKLFG
ncbi:MAG: S-methyl-5-thioribose-1-phosphate isomerase [Eubacteriales bacterium]|nr:S-methyl-5-thioribose-1-phosphate isomerase [Eubacteriales bacterium]